MPEDIFLSEYDATTDHHLVVEGDDEAVWAYLLDADQKILLHGFVCSLVEPLDDWTAPIDKGKPPPLTKRFANSHSVVPNLTEDQIHIGWKEKQVAVFIDDTLYLVIDILARTARSKALSRPGRYGLPLEA